MLSANKFPHGVFSSHLKHGVLEDMTSGAPASTVQEFAHPALGRESQCSVRVATALPPFSTSRTLLGNFPPRLGRAEGIEGGFSSRLESWWRREELNFRHADYETAALPLSYAATKGPLIGCFNQPFSF